VRAAENTQRTTGSSAVTLGEHYTAIKTHEFCDGLRFLNPHARPTTAIQTAQRTGARRALQDTQRARNNDLPAGLFWKADDEYVRFEVFTVVSMKNVVFWDIKNPVRTSQETLLLCYRAQPVNAV
jgi:hypothetical protein